MYPNEHQLTIKELLEKKTRPSVYTGETCKPLQLKFIRLKARSLLRLQIRCLSLPIKTTILEVRQFLKRRDISQSIMEVKVLYRQLQKCRNLFQIQSERLKHYQFRKIKLKSGQPPSVHGDFAKII